MRSTVRVAWLLAMLAVLGWSLVVFAARFGAAALDDEAPTIALLIPVLVVPLLMHLPVRWIERRQGPDARRVPSSTATFVELPAFAGVCGIAAAVAWSDDLRIATLLCLCVSAWAVAAPLVLRARLRPAAAEHEAA